MTHGSHIYAKAYDMEKAKMCAYTQSDNALPHCKCVMQCCSKCPIVNLPDQKTYDHYSNTSTSIHFHIYHPISRCTSHGRLPLTEKCFVASVKRILLQNNQQKYTLEKS